MLLFLQFSSVGETEVGSIGVERSPSPTPLPGLDSGGGGGSGGGSIGLRCGGDIPSPTPSGAMVWGRVVEVVGVRTRRVVWLV